MNVSQTCSKIFELQEMMNSIVNPAWKMAGYAWYRASFVEAAELMEFVGHKWWKKQDFNKEQAGLELVDILHFMVADMLVSGYDSTTLATAAETANSRYKSEFNKEYALDAIDDFCESTLISRGVVPKDFFPMVYALGFDYKWIFAWYIGKNCLNVFRQNNGYKTGTYVKIWNGREDNEVLASLVSSGITDFDSLYAALTSEYEKVEK